jgi:MarR family transcriptional regulator, organic hydroperoxide resistance regulator
VISENEQKFPVILALQRATHATLRALADRLTGLDLSPSEINALACLADGQVRSVGQLAHDTGTLPTTLTSLLDRLARRGYLTRQLDPADRRSFQVALTEEGRPAAEAARSAMTDLERETLAAIPAADLAGFRAVVHALAQAQAHP